MDEITMPYSLRVDPGERFVEAKATGILSQAEVLGGIRDIVNHPEFGVDYSVLVDLTELRDLPIFGADVRERTELDKSLEHRFGKAKFAIVATRDLFFGLARMYELLMDDSSIEVQTFRELEQAQAWLEER